MAAINKTGFEIVFIACSYQYSVSLSHDALVRSAVCD